MMKDMIHFLGSLAVQIAVVLIASANAVHADGPCIPKVLIDPGHGGTDTSNGYKLGTACWHNLCTERDQNLAVAIRLSEILTTMGYPDGTRQWMTRYGDTKIMNDLRAAMAESLAVDQFISIHHDGNTDTSINRTQMLYCNAPTTPDGLYYRDSTSTLALKVGYKIRDTFQLTYQSPGVRCDLTVLRNTSMASVLSEASFITNPTEAQRFVSGGRADDEGEAIFDGLCSYILNRGFAIVENSYSSSGFGNGGNVKVDRRLQTSPYVSAWGLAEGHDIAVPSEYVFPDGWRRTFFRWVEWHDWLSKRDTSQNITHSRYDTSVYVTVPTTQLQFHPYLALYTGGPYAASISPPHDTVFAGDSVGIPWSTSPGADSTTAVTVDLDRNGGAGGYTERIFGRDWFDRNWAHNWVISGPATSNAKLRIKADDYAGNTTTAYSGTFVIYDCGHLTLTNKVLTVNKPAITQLDLNYDANKAHKLTLKVYRLDGGTWMLAGTPYLGTQFPDGHTHIQWTIDQPHQGQNATYRMDGACSTSCAGNGAILADQFSVQVATNQNPAILQGPFLERARTCVQYYVNYKIRVYAYDAEDGTSLRYAWSVQHGCLQDMGQSCTTLVPEVSYMASRPGYPPCSHAAGFSASASSDPIERVSLTVLDAHGGRTDTSHTFEMATFFCGPQPACDCGVLGDVNAPLPPGGDGLVDISDVLRLISIVFSNGTPSFWVETCPVNRSDVWPDGVLDVHDVTTLINYVFVNGTLLDPCDYYASSKDLSMQVGRINAGR